MFKKIYKKNKFANKSFSNKTLPYNKILFFFISSVDSLIHLLFCIFCCYSLLSHMWEEIKDEKNSSFLKRKKLIKNNNS